MKRKLIKLYRSILKTLAVCGKAAAQAIRN